MYCAVVTEMVMVEEAGAGEVMVVAEATVVVEATVVMTEEVEEEVVVDMTVVAIAMHQSKLLIYSLGSAVLLAYYTALL